MFSIKDYSVFFDGCSVCALPAGIIGIRKMRLAFHGLLHCHCLHHLGISLLALDLLSLLLHFGSGCIQV